MYLTPDELVERYRSSITLRTLANWRSKGEGPPYTKIGGKVLYNADAVQNWEASRDFGDPRLRATRGAMQSATQA